MLGKTTPFIFVISIFLVINFIAGCELKIGGRKDKNKDEDIAVPVILHTVERGEISKFLRLSGVLEALREVEIYSQTSGIIVELAVEEGMSVGEGRLLLRLESREQQLALERARALVSRENANLIRAEELFKNEMLAEDAYQLCQLNLRDAELRVGEAELALERTRILAPFSGTIAERFVDKGDRINMSRTLFKIVDESRLLLEVWVNEDDLQMLRLGQSGAVIPFSDRQSNSKAKLIRVSPVVDPTFGKLKVTFEIDESPSNLKPGQYVELVINIAKHSDVLVIPKCALVYEAGIPIVFVRKDSLVFRRPVKIGLETGDIAEIIGGLGDAEEIVVDGQSTLRDSTLINPRKPSKPEEVRGDAGH